MDLRTQMITFLNHVFRKISKEMGKGIANRTISATTTPGLEACDRNGTLFDMVDWWLVPAEFAEHARQLAEIVVDTRLGLLWGQTVPTVFMLLFPPEMLEILDNKNAQ